MATRRFPGRDRPNDPIGRSEDHGTDHRHARQRHPAPGPGHRGRYDLGDLGEPEIILTGTGGNDRIFGRGGDDALVGDAPIIAATGRGGNDLLSGGAGDDFLYGDADFQLFGRGGNDTLRQDAIGAPDFEDPDYVVPRSVGDAGFLMAGSVGGDDKIFGAGVLIGDGFEMEDARGGNDLLDASSATFEASLWGDCTVGLSGASVAGADSLLGGAAGDFLFGDAYFLDDEVVGGKDRLCANGGDDTLHGDARVLQGSATGGNDLLRGGYGSDEIYGDGRELSGSAVGGADQIYGAGGDDELWGDGILLEDASGGADRFHFSGNFGQDIIHDFRIGEDVLRIAGVPAGDVVIDGRRMATRSSPR